MKTRKQQHQGSLATCGRIKEAWVYFLRHKKRTSIQINHDLNTASPRDVVRALRANGMILDGECLGKNANGKLVYQWTLGGVKV